MGYYPEITQQNNTCMTKKDTSKEEKSYLELLCDKIGETAVHYGFTIIKAPHITTEDLSKTKPFRDFDYYSDAEEKVALMRWYTEENLQAGNQPLMVHYKKPVPGSTQKKRPSDEVHGFEIMGSSRPTCEALLIKVGLAALSDLGYKDLYVDINTIGDKESISKFDRDLSNYYRKNANELPSKLRQEFKKNHYSILTDASAESEEFRKNAPQPMGSLSEIGRVHFKEVLEYMEAFEVTYKIKSNLLANKHFGTHTVFEIRTMDKKNAEDGTLLAYGYRYNYLGKKMGLKKDVPSVGLTIVVKKSVMPDKKVIIKNMKRPKYYLVQLGATAKLKALNVVEHLRKHKIPVYHSLTKDKITGQLSGAEYMHATHVLIIGQKEAIENTIVVRDVITRVQETVSILELADFLRNLEKK